MALNISQSFCLYAFFHVFLIVQARYFTEALSISHMNFRYYCPVINIKSLVTFVLSLIMSVSYNSLFYDGLEVA